MDTYAIFITNTKLLAKQVFLIAITTVITKSIPHT